MPIISSISGNFSPIGRSRKPFNNATGGTVTEYTSGGITYRVHSFTSSSSLVVLSATDPFDYLLVGGGGSGGNAGSTGGGGGGAGQVRTGSLLLTPQSYTITVGGAAQNTVAFGLTSVAGNAGNSSGTGGSSGNGFSGGVAPTSSSSGGSGGGAGGNGYNGSDNGSTTTGGPGVSNSLRTGSAQTYAVGGTGGNYAGGGGGNGDSPTTIGGGGGGGRFSGGSGVAGAAGIVVVRYRIK